MAKGKIPTMAKMRFWLENNLNVLFIGRHGVGKTSLVRDVFNQAGLVYRMYSAATMDPWVDFIGVPKEKIDENGESYLSLVKPRAFQRGEVQAIFMDEFNRCLTGDTKIALADGSFKAIKDLVGKKEFYVYAYDKDTQKIVIGRGHSARKTISKASLVKVTLDNGQVIRCTSDHPFLMRDGHYVNAIDLQENDSLMPLRRKLSDIKRNNGFRLIGYEEVYQPILQEWALTHVLSDNYNIVKKKYKKFKGSVRHHKNRNKLDNTPTNIELLSWSAHKKIHTQDASIAGKMAHKLHPDLYARTIGKLQSKKKALINSIATRQKSASYKCKRSKLTKKFFSLDGNKDKQSRRCSSAWVSGQFDNVDQKQSHLKRNKTISMRHAFANFVDNFDFTEEDWDDSMKNNPNYIRGTLSSQKIKLYFGSFDEFKNQVFNNHKVVSVEVISEKEDVYDITVDDYHNFALESGIFVHNSHKKIRNAVMELLQFKSINDDRLPNLRVVWAAINPDDEDGTYDVESIDPAQLDRFHIHVELPYKPSKQYFFNAFGSSIAETAINWWNTLPTEQKDKVSPRRLDYALQVWKLQGSLEDVLPAGANIRKLREALKKTPLMEELNALYAESQKSTRTVDEVHADIVKFLADENNYDGVVKEITSNPAMIKVFVPCMPQEKISVLLQDVHVVRSFFLRNLSAYPSVTEVITQIAESDTNKSIAREFNRSLQRVKVEKMQNLSTKSVTNVNKADSYYDLANNKNTIDFGKSIRKSIESVLDDTYSRKLAFDAIERYIPKNLAVADAHSTLELLDILIRRSHNGVLKRWHNLMGVINHCIATIIDGTGYILKFRTEYVHLSRWVASQPDFYFQVI